MRFYVHGRRHSVGLPLWLWPLYAVMWLLMATLVVAIVAIVLIGIGLWYLGVWLLTSRERPSRQQVKQTASLLFGRLTGRL